MTVKVGDVVRIGCVHSKYDGVVGEVFKVDEVARYAIVDMPKGTEERIEGLRVNAILEDMRRSEKQRKSQIVTWPKGEPEWFPLRWLRALESGEK